MAQDYNRKYFKQITDIFMYHFGCLLILIMVFNAVSSELLQIYIIKRHTFLEWFGLIIGFFMIMIFRKGSPDIK